MTAESLDDLVARLRKRHSLSHNGESFVYVYDDDDLAAADAIVALRARAEAAEAALGDAARALPQVAGTVANRIEVYRKSYSDQIAALREDAERYRWLRDEAWDDNAPFVGGRVLWDYDSSHLDTAIDSARLAEKDKGG